MSGKWGALRDSPLSLFEANGELRAGTIVGERITVTRAPL
jgi:hypothetical protein